MVQNTRATVKTLSLQSMADFRCKILETHPDGMELRIDGREVWVHFLGRFNAYNLLCVYAAALLLGADREEVLQIMSTLHPVSGRFEFVRAADGTTAIVDYAHTPDALEKCSRPSRRSAARDNSSSCCAAAAATGTRPNAPKWRRSP